MRLPPVDPGGSSTRAEHEVGLTVLGAPVVVQTRSPAQADQVAGLWARCRLPGRPASDEGPDGITEGAPGPGGTVTATVADSTLPLTGEMLQRLTAHLTEIGIEHQSGRAVMLHASGVGDSSGRVLALVASSETGKTTAARLLCRDGLGYVTDETVAVTPTGAVVPFAKPLALRPDPGRPEDKVHVSPDELGLGLAADDLTLHGIVLLARDPARAGPPLLSPVPVLEAAVELIGHTSSLTRLHRPLQAVLGLLDRAPAVRLGYREISQCDGLVRALLAARTAPPEVWSVLDAPDPDDVPPAGYSCAPVEDAVAVGEEGLLLVRSRPVRLSPLGLTLWRAARPGASLDELVRAAVSDHGDRPDAPALVADAVERMTSAGVLRSPAAPVGGSWQASPDPPTEDPA